MGAFMVDTIDSALRDNNTLGDPGSGDYKVKKGPLRTILKRIEGSAGIGAVTVATKAELDAITDKADNAPGFVVGDSTASNNGQYTWDDSGSAWVKIRDLPDTLAVLENIGGTANAITADTATGVDPAAVQAIVLTAPPGTNASGAVTITLNSGSAESIKSASGTNPAAGDIVEDVATIFFKVGSEWRQIFTSNPNATFDHQGDYDNGTTYTLDQVVTGSDDAWYQLKIASATGDNPVSGGSGDWLKILDGTALPDNSVTNAKLTADSVSSDKKTAATLAKDEGFKTAALLLADTVLTYAASQAGTVAAGNVIKAQGFRYDVVDSAEPAFDKSTNADGYHLITAGGVKLRISSSHSVYRPQMFGELNNDGSTDDLPLINLCLDAASIDNKKTVLPKGDLAVDGYLSLSDGQEIEGRGRSTTLRQISTTNRQVIYDTANDNCVVSNINLIAAQSGGGDRHAVWLDGVSGWTFDRVFGVGGTDSNLIFLVDCEGVYSSNLYFDGGASRNGYAWYVAGCTDCVCESSKAYRPDFGFVITGQDISGTYTSNDGSGNRVVNCYVSDHEGHAFDINASSHNTIANCTAENYGGASTNTAFQIKHPSGDNASHNVVIGCVARNVPVGFGGQQGSKNQFVGCVAEDVTDGFFFNSQTEAVVSGCSVVNFTGSGIKISSSSDNNVFNGLLLSGGDAGAIGIEISASGGGGNFFDSIKMRGTFGTSISIGSGANNNRFGHNVYVLDKTISDSSGNTIWPIKATTPIVDLSSTGNYFGDYHVRGMVVAVAKFILTETITGTPQVRIGRYGATSEIASQQAITGSAGAAVALTQASQLLGTSAIVQGVVGVAGTGGAGFFQLEGLPRL